VAKQAPLVKSHNRMVLSLLALARIIPEGKNARLQTSVVQSERVEIGFGLDRVQSRIRPEPSPEANSALAVIKNFDESGFCYGRSARATIVEESENQRTHVGSTTTSLLLLSGFEKNRSWIDNLLVGFYHK
jgi:hypothetical protein